MSDDTSTKTIQLAVETRAEVESLQSVENRLLRIAELQEQIAGRKMMIDVGIRGGDQIPSLGKDLQSLQKQLESISKFQAKQIKLGGAEATPKVAGELSAMISQKQKEIESLKQSLSAPEKSDQLSRAVSAAESEITKLRSALATAKSIQEQMFDGTNMLADAEFNLSEAAAKSTTAITNQAKALRAKLEVLRRASVLVDRLNTSESNLSSTVQGNADLASSQPVPQTTRERVQSIRSEGVDRARVTTDNYQEGAVADQVIKSQEKIADHQVKAISNIEQRIRASYSSLADGRKGAQVGFTAIIDDIANKPEKPDTAFEERRKAVFEQFAKGVENLNRLGNPDKRGPSPENARLNKEEDRLTRQSEGAHTRIRLNKEEINRLEPYAGRIDKSLDELEEYQKEIKDARNKAKAERKLVVEALGNLSEKDGAVLQKITTATADERLTGEGFSKAALNRLLKAGVISSTGNDSSGKPVGIQRRDEELENLLFDLSDINVEISRQKSILERREQIAKLERENIEREERLAEISIEKLKLVGQNEERVSLLPGKDVARNRDALVIDGRAVDQLQLKGRYDEIDLPGEAVSNVRETRATEIDPRDWVRAIDEFTERNIDYPDTGMEQLIDDLVRFGKLREGDQLHGVDTGPEALHKLLTEFDPDRGIHTVSVESAGGFMFDKVSDTVGAVAVLNEDLSDISKLLLNFRYQQLLPDIQKLRPDLEVYTTDIPKEYSDYKAAAPKIEFEPLTFAKAEEIGTELIEGGLLERAPVKELEEMARRYKVEISEVEKILSDLRSRPNNDYLVEDNLFNPEDFEGYVSPDPVSSEDHIRAIEEARREEREKIQSAMQESVVEKPEIPVAGSIDQDFDKLDLAITELEELASVEEKVSAASERSAESLQLQDETLTNKIATILKATTALGNFNQTELDAYNIAGPEATPEVRDPAEDFSEFPRQANLPDRSKESDDARRARLEREIQLLERRNDEILRERDYRIRAATLTPQQFKALKLLEENSLDDGRGRVGVGGKSVKGPAIHGTVAKNLVNLPLTLGDNRKVSGIFDLIRDEPGGGRSVGLFGAAEIEENIDRINEKRQQINDPSHTRAGYLRAEEMRRETEVVKELREEYVKLRNDAKSLAGIQTTLARHGVASEETLKEVQEARTRVHDRIAFIKTQFPDNSDLDPRRKPVHPEGTASYVIGDRFFNHETGREVEISGIQSAIGTPRIWLEGLLEEGRPFTQASTAAEFEKALADGMLELIDGPSLTSSIRRKREVPGERTIDPLPKEGPAEPDSRRRVLDQLQNIADRVNNLKKQTENVKDRVETAEQFHQRIIEESKETEQGLFSEEFDLTVDQFNLPNVSNSLGESTEAASEFGKAEDQLTQSSDRATDALSGQSEELQEKIRRFIEATGAAQDFATAEQATAAASTQAAQAITQSTQAAQAATRTTQAASAGSGSPAPASGSGLPPGSGASRSGQFGGGSGVIRSVEDEDGNPLRRRFAGDRTGRTVDVSFDPESGDIVSRTQTEARERDLTQLTQEYKNRLRRLRRYTTDQESLIADIEQIRNNFQAELNARFGDIVDTTRSGFGASQFIEDLNQEIIRFGQSRTLRTTFDQFNTDFNNALNNVALDDVGSHIQNLQSLRDAIVDFRDNTIPGQLRGGELFRDVDRRIAEIDRQMQNLEGALEAQRRLAAHQGGHGRREEFTEILNHDGTRTEERTITSVQNGANQSTRAMLRFNDAGRLVDGTVRSATQSLREFRSSSRFATGEFIENTKTVAQWAASVAVYQNALKLANFTLSETIALQRRGAVLTTVFRGAAEDATALKGEVLDLAAAYGRAGDEALDVAVRAARLGLSRNQVREFTRVALQAANVAEIPAGDAAEALSAIRQSFDLEVSEMAGVLNDLNALSNTVNTTTRDLLQGIGRVGPLAKQAGLSLEGLNALIATGVSATGRPGAEFGNATKSIIVALSNPATQERLKELFDFDVKDQSGQFKDFDQILGDLFVTFNRLNKADQQQLLQIVGKKQQASRLAVILNKYANVQQNLVTQLRAGNVTQRENADIQATLQSRIQGLQSAWLNLIATTSGAFENQGFLGQGISDAVSGLTNLLRVMESIAQLGDGSFGRIATTVAGLGAAAGGIALVRQLSQNASQVGGNPGFFASTFNRAAQIRDEIGNAASGAADNERQRRLQAIHARNPNVVGGQRQYSGLRGQLDQVAEGYLTLEQRVQTSNSAIARGIRGSARMSRAFSVLYNSSLLVARGMATVARSLAGLYLIGEALELITVFSDRAKNQMESLTEGAVKFQGQIRGLTDEAKAFGVVAEFAENLGEAIGTLDLEDRRRSIETFVQTAGRTVAEQERLRIRLDPTLDTETLKRRFAEVAQAQEGLAATARDEARKILEDAISLQNAKLSELEGRVAGARSAVQNAGGDAGRSDVVKQAEGAAQELRDARQENLNRLNEILETQRALTGSIDDSVKSAALLAAQFELIKEASADLASGSASSDRFGQDVAKRNELRFQIETGDDRIRIIEMEAAAEIAAIEKANDDILTAEQKAKVEQIRNRENLLSELRSELGALAGEADANRKLGRLSLKDFIDIGGVTREYYEIKDTIDSLRDNGKITEDQSKLLKRAIDPEFFGIPKISKQEQEEVDRLRDQFDIPIATPELKNRARAQRGNFEKEIEAKKQEVAAIDEKVAKLREENAELLETAKAADENQQKINELVAAKEKAIQAIEKDLTALREEKRINDELIEQRERLIRLQEKRDFAGQVATNRFSQIGVGETEVDRQINAVEEIDKVVQDTLKSQGQDIEDFNAAQNERSAIANRARPTFLDPDSTEFRRLEIDRDFAVSSVRYAEGDAQTVRDILDDPSRKINPKFVKGFLGLDPNSATDDEIRAAAAARVRRFRSEASEAQRRVFEADPRNAFAVNDIFDQQQESDQNRVTGRLDNSSTSIQEKQATLAAASNQLRQIEIDLATRKHTIEREILQAQVDQTEEARKRLALASREDQLRVALLSKFTRENGPLNERQFQFFDINTRNAAVNYLPGAAPESVTEIGDLRREQERLKNEFDEQQKIIEGLREQIRARQEELPTPSQINPDTVPLESPAGTQNPNITVGDINVGDITVAVADEVKESLEVIVAQLAVGPIRDELAELRRLVEEKNLASIGETRGGGSTG